MQQAMRIHRGGALKFPRSGWKKSGFGIWEELEFGLINTQDRGSRVGDLTIDDERLRLELGMICTSVVVAPQLPLAQPPDDPHHTP
jgi:hypothetical protein